MGTIKKILWRIGLYNKCPMCGSKFIRKPLDDLEDRYECRSCGWGKTKQMCRR